MTTDTSIWHFILHADFIVKCVLILLAAASIFSWTTILQRFSLYGQAQREAKQFEKQFWSGTHMDELHRTISANNTNPTGLAAIFSAGYEEYQKLNQHTEISPEAVIEGTERAMRLASTQHIEQLEKNISFLATIGSTSPYIGLFGTVWGIMNAFRALGQVQQASIAMVAPGISEALIATAIGLFAAIPAVIAYNRFSNQLERIETQYESFQDELTRLLHRDAHRLQR